MSAPTEREKERESVFMPKMDHRNLERRQFCKTYLCSFPSQVLLCSSGYLDSARDPKWISSAARPAVNHGPAGWSRKAHWVWFLVRAYFAVHEQSRVLLRTYAWSAAPSVHWELWFRVLLRNDYDFRIWGWRLQAVWLLNSADPATITHPSGSQQEPHLSEAHGKTTHYMCLHFLV